MKTFRKNSNVQVHAWLCNKTSTNENSPVWRPTFQLQPVTFDVNRKKQPRMKGCTMKGCVIRVPCQPLKCHCLILLKETDLSCLQTLSRQLQIIPNLCKDHAFTMSNVMRNTRERISSLKSNIVPNLVLKIKNKNLDLFFCLWSRQPWCLDQKDNVETDFVLLRKHSNTQIASTCSDFIPLNWTMYAYLPVKDVTKEFTQGTSTDTWTISSFGMWVDASESDNSLIVFYSNSQFFLLPKEAVMLIFKSRQFHSIMNASSLWDRLKTPGQRYTC